MVVYREHREVRVVVVGILRLCRHQHLPECDAASVVRKSRDAVDRDSGLIVVTASMLLRLLMMVMGMSMKVRTTMTMVVIMMTMMTMSPKMRLMKLMKFATTRELHMQQDDAEHDGQDGVQDQFQMMGCC